MSKTTGWAPPRPWSLGAHHGSGHAAEIKYVLQCGNAKSVPPDDDDPVLLTRIVAIADGETQNGEIHIRHFVASGENYTRNKQYRDLIPIR
jgi:hypothetical protein